MLQAIEQLLVIQDRDRRIRLLRHELGNAPLERKALETRLAAANSEVETLKAEIQKLEVQKKTLQGNANGKREQIGRFRTQQMQTRKNEEYQALTNEIAHFEKEIVEIEDQELEVMEKIDAMGPKLAGAQARANEARQGTARQIEALEAKVTALGGNLKEVQEERARLIVGVDADLLNVYDRLFASKDGNAVVALEGDVCTGCHMTVTTQVTLTVKAGHSVTHCEHCGRILYFPRG